MSFIIILMLLGYSMSLLCLAMPAIQYSPHPLSKNLVDKNYSFSVIVVYRNEANVLPQLLKGFEAQSYPSELFEVLLINDGSTDDSVKIVEQFKKDHPAINLVIKNRLEQSASAKKDGIAQAVKIARHDHIITTDADCSLPPNWIQSYNDHYKEYSNATLVAGPVAIEGSGFTARLQELEMIALQTIAMGAFFIGQPFLCSGANLCFRKKAFYQVSGYEGNDHLSSGDDVFLLEKLAAENILQVHYLKNQKAIVTTTAKKTFAAMMEQRARWARKGTETKSTLNKFVAFHVGIISLFFFLMPLFLWLDLVDQQLFVAFYLVKLFTDFVVLLVGNQFYESKQWSLFFVPNYFVYPYTVIGSGLKSIGTINWRGRPIDKNPI